MIDRELLELAAKAAGYPPKWKGNIKISEDAPLYERYWNPLADDGDALRLAIKLRLSVSLIDLDEDGYYSAIASLWGKGIQIRERVNDDDNAAMRRAIVRAAAEIGKAIP